MLDTPTRVAVDAPPLSDAGSVAPVAPVAAPRGKRPDLLTVADAKAIVAIGDKEYSYSLLEIMHSHIDPQVHFTDAGLRLIPLESKIGPGRIGYIDGSGDEIPEILKDMGYEVVLLNDDMLTADQLAKFKIVIAGMEDIFPLV